MVCSPETWCEGASSSREPSSIPAGYASHTGYQYDSISRVAGHQDPAPPSKFSKDGGFKNSVFKGIFVSNLYYHPLYNFGRWRLHDRVTVSEWSEPRARPKLRRFSDADTTAGGSARTTELRPIAIRCAVRGKPASARPDAPARTWLPARICRVMFML